MAMMGCPPAVVGVDRGVKAWHVAPRAARESIQRHGLDASRRTYDWRQDDDMVAFFAKHPEARAACPDGTYLWANKAEALDMAADIEGDVWEVDVAGLDVRSDPWRPVARMVMYDDARYVEAPIPPDRLVLISAHHATGVSDQRQGQL